MRHAALAALALALWVPLASAAAHRLPAGTSWGRCLLVVAGRTRIAGRCSYRIGPDGGFHIDGPRQVFDGIDYPAADTMAEQRSTDFWADVFRDGDGWGWYGNSAIGAVHGDPSDDALRQDGACFRGAAVRICLWRQ